MHALPMRRRVLGAAIMARRAGRLVGPKAVVAKNRELNRQLKYYKLI